MAKKGKPPAKNKPPAKKQKKRGGSLSQKLLGFLTLVLALMLLPTSLLLAAGMVPSMAAYIVDRDRNKTTAISVAALNACGVLHYEIALWKGAQTLSHMKQILGNPESWAFMFGAASLGWGIVYVVPPLVGGFIAHRSEMRVHELDRRQAALREGWGTEVTGDHRGEGVSPAKLRNAA
jgi:hypothetical protein